ncbi:MAG: ral secretion pathway protein [Acidobacteriota bacterium]|nr:ral secretion pathway protein [Acidobacteriota bacterium]
MRMNNRNCTKFFHGKRALLPFLVGLVIASILFTGCTSLHLKRAEFLKNNRQYEDALKYYFKALKSHPKNIALKTDIDRVLKEASIYYFQAGKDEESAGNKTKALFLYKKSLQFDPGNSEVRKNLMELGQGEKTVKPIEELKKEVEVNIGLPAIIKSQERLDLEFKSPTSLMAIFGVLAKTGDVNILFDSEFKDMRVTLKLVDVTFYEALEHICRIYKCSYYILDDKNIVIALNSGDSAKRYKKLLIKNIYFANVNAEDAKKIIEKTYKPEQMTLNDLTNSLLVTDSLENLLLVEKLAQFIDKRKAEIEVEIEILEVNNAKLKEYGTELSAWQVGAKIEGTDSGIKVNEIDNISSSDIIMSVPQMVWKFYSSITDSKILAQPKIRGLDKEKINIQLGEQRPIIRTTFVPISTGGVNQQPITSYSMTDVGISITLTPVVHSNREVTLELQFELTNVIDKGSNYVPPTLGSRKVTTKLRLRDGETGIIAGLMKGTSSSGVTGIPILNRLPILKEIFSSNTKNSERTDILLSITPRILRMPEITNRDTDTYYIGTEGKVELKKWESGEFKKEEKKVAKKAGKGKKEKKG